MDRKSKYLLFALPSFILIFTVMLFPVGYAIIYSFTDFRLGKSAKFIGLENYISIMIYIPYFITAAAMGVIFRWMFMSNWGIIDQICRMIGISTPGWLDSPFWSRVVIILGEVFQNTPFSVIILYAGLQSMPLDQIEAAKIDGANNWQLFTKIKLPNLRQLIIIIFMMRTMDAFRLFDRVNVTTGGGPGISTETLAIYNYTTTFTKLRVGRGCAIGVITLIILAVIINVIMKVLRVKEVD